MKEIFNIFPDGYLPLYHGGNMQKDDSLCSYSAASVEEVLSLHEQGVIRDYIYFALPKSKADIAALIGKCRLVANSLQEIQDINAVALEHNKPGYLEDIGLRVVPSRFDDGMQMGIPESMLPTLAGKIKKMAGISVRGCFVQGGMMDLSGVDLADYFHESYQVVKRMTTLLPCSMFYFCLCGILDALENERNLYPHTMEEILHAAEIVGMQNQTAFYARLLVE